MILKVHSSIRVSLFLIFPFVAQAELPLLWEATPQDTAITAAITQGIEAQIRAEFEKTHKAVRDAHAKQHGCVLADFTVVDGLKEQGLDVGIFKEAGKKYESVIRFSNGSGDARSDDRLASPRGMAIKVMNVAGEKMIDDESTTQDFPMINHPVFFIKNPLDYVSFMKDRKAFFEDPAHLEEAKIVGAMNNPESNPPRNVLESTFFSMTPRQFGATDKLRPIKYSAQPVVCEGSEALVPLPLKDDENALRIALRESLDKQAFCYAFRIQKQTNEEDMPVSNPTKIWNENESPWITVANVKIFAKQDFDAREEICENLALNPWHSLAEHQPLGGIEFVRRTVYQATSKLRHELNEAAVIEPKGFADLN
ncbi:MAG: catalase family protein [Bdellovibrionota bacterium]